MPGFTRQGDTRLRRGCRSELRDHRYRQWAEQWSVSSEDFVPPLPGQQCATAILSVDLQPRHSLVSQADQRELWVVRLGRMAYSEALELQRAVARDRISGVIPHDVLLLVEHPAVVTLGRSSKQKNLISSPEFLASKGVELFEVERGGDVTFHGLGQLVGYPIIDLKRHRQDLHWFLRQVEEALIRTLSEYGISGERSPGYTGVWTSGRKIASIGVHSRDWVTWHGFALNVVTDLSYFDLVVPCGIQGVEMTSVAKEMTLRGEPVAGDLSVGSVGDVAASQFGDVFGLTPVDVPAGDLPRTAGTAGTAGTALPQMTQMSKDEHR